MKALLLLLAAWWIAAGVGSLILARLKVLQNYPLERFVYASALGLGAAAYGVLALGLIGQLSFWPVTLWWLSLACLGFTGMRSNGKHLLDWTRQMFQRKQQSGESSRLSLLSAFAGIILLLAAGIIILACFRPPGGHEWDALAYHLADPKIYLQQHRITSLPTEHHSNFPFTMEMLFTVGLLYEGFALANLFHFLTAILTVLGLIAFCRRVLSPAVGMLAAVIFVTTPLVLWESGIAYIDIALGLYVTLALFAGVSLIEAQRSDTSYSSWAALAGLMMGLALGIKYLALLPLTFLALLFLLRRVPWRIIAVYLALAIGIASPWYIKNIVVLRNPVYPYLFRVFPHSLYWSTDRAKPYEEEQKSFGYDHSLTEPVVSLQNLMLTPWRWMTNANRYTNTGDYTFTSLIGGLYAAFLFALLCKRRLPTIISDLLIVSGLMLIAWFFVSQHSRYLVPLLPLLAVLAGYSANSLLRKETQPTQPDALREMVRWLAGGVITGHCLFVFWSVFVLPSGGKEAMEVMAAGLPPTALSVPETITALSQAEQKKILRRRLDTYSAVEWLNQKTPNTAGVILYEDVHGYYLDRPYLWGNREHSSYIPYDWMEDGSQLTQWLRTKDIRYVLINLNASPDNTHSPQDRPAGREEEALRLWYVDKSYAANDWRRLLGDAMQKRLWTPVFAAHGVVVLEIGDSAAAATKSQGERL